MSKATAQGEGTGFGGFTFGAPAPPSAFSFGGGFARAFTFGSTSPVGAMSIKGFSFVAATGSGCFTFAIPAASATNAVDASEATAQGLGTGSGVFKLRRFYV
eukprot:CAMPEP_0194290322 /NCGR_PEP_ID=MMETSP0169-20130528/41005_1 /TAXON_ID=218684 /ORGANISM="Corethron pennatum, Strain L29A3" /LENGTH=101 /DNA_ID=CAMNT_0039037877 /DNA_START=46 /DNA_END=348 /DNA_ORIENTATION=-